MVRRTSAVRAARGAFMLLVVGAAVACASSGGGGGGGATNAITREMIDSQTSQNAYTIVQRYRPRWLSPRTQGTINNPEPSFPQVYVDDVRFGPIDTLYRIDGTQIERIEFMSGLDATTRFGLGHDGGAIMVWTVNSRARRRRTRPSV